MTHKSGYVNIIGNPNVGKSTLINKLVGEKLSIITSKSQTTRHRILAIINEKDVQIIFSDTPGIIKTNYKLQKNMMNFVNSAFEDADILLYVVEVGHYKLKDDSFSDKLKKFNKPILILINKIDTSSQEIVNRDIIAWNKEFPNSHVYPISALNNFNLDLVLNQIKELLPLSPPYFSKDTLTDKSERFFVSEIIREKILKYYSEEIPYSVEVEIESFKELENIINISTIIYVVRESQKGIIIGHKGRSLKKIGSLARRDLENFLGKKIYLEMKVKVSKDWRNNDKQLKRFGYI